MKLFINNKTISLTGTSSVLDENGNEIFKVTGKLFSPTHKKTILDKNNNVLFKVRNKFWHFITRKAFIYNAMGEKVATLSSNAFSFQYIVKDYSEDIIIHSSNGNHNFVITSGETEIAKLTRQFNPLIAVGDKFVLETENNHLVDFLVALTIALDNICDARERDSAD